MGNRKGCRGNVSTHVADEFDALHMPYVPREIYDNRTVPQEVLWRSTFIREIFYGGAAGGGKSTGLLADALLYVDVPRYSALILRRTYGDLSLPGALMDVASHWLSGTDAKWSGNDHQWTFPSGATLTFGYLEHRGSEGRYKSAEFQYIAFDELTDFSEYQYRFMFSRARRPSTGIHGASPRGVSLDNVPIRVRSASNPGGPGHVWVKRRMVEQTWPHAPARHDRVFIPARLEDNPNLDIEEYEETLANLPPALRARIRSGDWEVRDEGSLFKRWYFKVIDKPPAGITMKVRAWDCAATEPDAGADPDWTCGLLAGALPTGEIVILDLAREQLEPAGVQDLQARVAGLDGRDVKVWEEMEPGSSGKTVIDNKRRSIFRGYAYDGQRPTGSKYVRAQPVATDAANGLVLLVRGLWNEDFLDEVPSFTGDNAVHDDIVDAMSLAHEKLFPIKTGGSRRLANPAEKRMLPRRIAR